MQEWWNEKHVGLLFNMTLYITYIGFKLTWNKFFFGSIPLFLDFARKRLRRSLYMLRHVSTTSPGNNNYYSEHGAALKPP